MGLGPGFVHTRYSLRYRMNHAKFAYGVFIIDVWTQVAQAPKGAGNMTLRNSVIFIRVCMGIERS